MDNPNSYRTPIGYICPQCRTELIQQYRTYCGQCGHAMPSEIRLQATDFAIYPKKYGQGLHSLGDVRDLIQRIGPTRHWLEEYHPTFRSTTIHIQGFETEQTALELLCTGTIRLELPAANGWFAHLVVELLPDQTCRLTDAANVASGNTPRHSIHAVSIRD